MGQADRQMPTFVNWRHIDGVMLGASGTCKMRGEFVNWMCSNYLSTFDVAMKFDGTGRMPSTPDEDEAAL